MTYYNICDFTEQSAASEARFFESIDNFTNALYAPKTDRK